MLRTVCATAMLFGAVVAVSACTAPSVSPTVAYLQQAQTATRAHDATAALAALNEAQSAWLTANSAWGNPVYHHEKRALREMGLARAAVHQARWGDAAHYIGSALTDPSTLMAG